MAGTSFFALLDDIVFLTKVAASKTAPVLGDDLAVNAQSLSGDIRPERELPVVYAVAKGSLLNKAVIVPVALLLSYFMPFLITPLLMLGGAFLCYEGVEKLLHYRQSEDDSHQTQLIDAVQGEPAQLLAFEQTKIRAAIKMDAVLSAEIIVIALGAIQSEAFTKQIAVLSLIAVLMTVGVYGLVALIVKLDDMALAIIRNQQAKAKVGMRLKFGQTLLVGSQYLLTSLSFIGMLACLLIGGEIFSHGIVPLHHSAETVVSLISQDQSWLELPLQLVTNFIIGVVVGGVVLAAIKLYQLLSKSN
ncbi:DUF808 domain-containing protein [Pseudoalteromonas fenneropenaei]|uniref:DUF808 domain-containing protein n=1 Tax=Pseudoalteromonas fenneropenaei TaxID=1737459 RepID=A0ABV7CIU8_9GAMM